MAKSYWLKFGSGDPRTKTGLTPTLLIFATVGGTNLTAPGITEPITGAGLYEFTYGPTLAIAFLADAGSSLSDTDRYIAAVLDPIQAVDEKVGYVTDSFGATSVDPSTLMGYMKRNQEFQEGNSTYNKTSNLWDIYSRGSSTLIAEKLLTNTTSSATKT